MDKQIVHFLTLFRIPPEFLTADASARYWESKEYSRSTLGFYKDIEVARKAIHENWTDMYEEGYYNVVLISSVAEGLCQQIPEEEEWYLVKPQIDEEVLAARQVRDRAWDEAHYFGKFFGKLIGRKYGVTDGTSLSEIFKISDKVAAELGMSSKEFLDIQKGTKAPVFSSAQWSIALTHLHATSDDLAELEKLKDLALKDTHFGVPDACRNSLLASGLGPKDGPMEKSDGWLVKGYELSKIERPKIFDRVCGLHL